MRLPPFRATLGQLLMLVAVSAVAFALLRTPVWPAIPALPPILICFAVERALGGRGVLRAMLGGLLTFVGLGVVLFTVSILAGVSSNWDSPESPFSVLLGLAVFGLLIGASVGGLAFLVLLLLGYRDDHVLPPEEAIGPIVWRGFGDAGIPRQQAGGSPR
jgi:hypothetical protein